MAVLCLGMLTRLSLLLLGFIPAVSPGPTVRVYVKLEKFVAFPMYKKRNTAGFEKDHLCTSVDQKGEKIPWRGNLVVVKETEGLHWQLKFSHEKCPLMYEK